MLHPTHRLSALLAAITFTISGCGGGGGADPTNDTAPPAATLYQIGGRLSGLAAGQTVVVGDASGPRTSLTANGAFSFPMPAGTAYDLSVMAQPAAQTCAVANGRGTATADVDTVAIQCQDEAAAAGGRTVAGTVTGLRSGNAVTLQLQSGSQTQETRVSADGRFAFAQPVAGAYSVTVRAAPPGQVCTVANGQGHAGPDGSVADVSVLCAGSAFRVTGTMNGNAGTVVLRNRASGESLTVIGNGHFEFVQPVALNAAYDIEVSQAQSTVGSLQRCTIAQGTGKATADVQIQVVCETDASAAPTPTPTPTPTRHRHRHRHRRQRQRPLFPRPPRQRSRTPPPRWQWTMT